MSLKLDILVFAAHPDDAELSCSGTIAAHTAMGKKVGIIDLTQGELGTRGNPELRVKEAEDAAKILGLSVRENLKMQDGFFKNDLEHQMKIVEAIRRFQPEIILANAITDRHPDHGKGAALIAESIFLSGLRKIETSYQGQQQTPWRPKTMYHYIQNNYIEPDFIIDVTDHWNTRIEAIKAFKSQFFDPDNREPETFISSQEFWSFLESRARTFGHRIGTTYGEGFTTLRTPGLRSLFNIL
ncbi:MAG: bacillithiol biosynthesis deacetylase BshB1 [Cyclobacteriaceae bacterium]|nr:bacillithiol biosynthesis deacetylase BshB1 [Cyclobacteriaceae bacterium]